MCKLCNSQPETVTRKDWSWSGIQTSAIDRSDSVEDWRNVDIAKTAHVHRRHVDGLLIYYLWNVWKERNSRNFDSGSQEEEEVASKAQEDFKTFLWANETPAFSVKKIYLELIKFSVVYMEFSVSDTSLNISLKVISQKRDPKTTFSVESTAEANHFCK
ncbi:hypothetical protein BRADI_1g36525v3 [Brachypodium distachyon]|uniref:Uncharacterized protein n=1 Tax=Brachypodium distachyon TaxID=15368 RepID=A0A2K2DN16_BRADI|nr:hypothetical protein BRADI_1g36525v3 [Brachypodium distachyon]